MTRQSHLQVHMQKDSSKILKMYLHTCVHCTIIYNIQELEATPKVNG